MIQWNCQRTSVLIGGGSEYCFGLQQSRHANFISLKLSHFFMKVLEQGKSLLNENQS